MGEESTWFLPRFRIRNQSESNWFSNSQQHPLRDEIMKLQSNSAASTRQCSASRGFSLIELLIVVSVILIIAAIAIPNFIRSKMAANEASAVQNLRNISTAEYLYSTTYSVNFTPDLPTLSGNTGSPDQTHAELIDTVLGSGIKSGYSIGYTAGATNSMGQVITYSVNGSPLVPGSTGQRYFYTDQTCVIRWNATGPAGANDIPVQ
jgi:type IV pilus assembly protein PilA